MPDLKRQRVRDPLHNLIEFDEGDPFERMLWRVVKTAPFQRRRRIRQLGFSDLVYPGATHAFRAYVAEDDDEARKFVWETACSTIKGA